MREPFVIRPIEPRDDEVVARILRAVMTELGASGPGFAIQDLEVDHMSRAYAAARSAYFVVELGGQVLGGGGIAPLAGGDADTCELRKMYFLPQLRGRGAGRALIERCLETAGSLGFRRCYLETLKGMNDAQRLYERSGFQRIRCAKGETGHHGCDTYYEKDLG